MPRRWIASRLSPPGGWSFGYKQALLSAIHRLHRLGATAARQHLRGMINAHFKDGVRITRIEADLESYIDWANQSNLIVADSKFRINLDIGGFLVLGGEVSRLDMTDVGYRAVILGDKPADWRQQLRLPLIQRAAAMKYGRPIQEIAVAMQNLDGTGLESLCFNEADISQAENDLRTLGESIRHLLPPA